MNAVGGTCDGGGRIGAVVVDEADCDLREGLVGGDVVDADLVRKGAELDTSGAKLAWTWTGDLEFMF
jgi:hypothetical protein